MQNEVSDSCRVSFENKPKKRGSKEFNQSFAQRKRGSFLSLQINLLVVGGSGHYRYQCVGFKGRIQQLRFNPWRLGRWKSGCILHCTEAAEKTEVTFQTTYTYSQKKVQKRRLSHLQQQNHLRRGFEACWSSKIKTGSTYQRCCLIFDSYQKSNPVQISLQVELRLMTLSMEKFKFQSN